MEPTFFATPADFRAWLEANHADRDELLVGFHKKGSGRPSITWPESVDEALCFGWIDGIRRRIDDDSYSIRFTPRKPRSIWSAVNTRRARRADRGRADDAGRASPRSGGATTERTGVYSFERREAAKLDAEQERRFRAAEGAWEWFQSQPPSYRRTALHWVVSAKRAETRERRLATLIEDSANGRTIKPLTR